MIRGGAEVCLRERAGWEGWLLWRRGLPRVGTRKKTGCVGRLSNRACCPPGELPASNSRQTVGETKNMSPRTLFEKVWDSHVVAAPEGRSALLYIDLHLVHEVTSPQAFDGLTANGRRLRHTLGTGASGHHEI